MKKHDRVNARGYKHGDTLYNESTGVLLRYDKYDDAWYNAGAESYNCDGDFLWGTWEFVGRFK